MSPFIWTGANLAMKDGAGLIKELLQARARAELKNRAHSVDEWLLEAVRNHERKMMRRAKTDLGMSNLLMANMVAPDGERNMRRVVPVAKALLVLQRGATRARKMVKGLF